MEVRKDATFAEKGMPFGLLEVRYPEETAWDLEGFEALKERELAALRERFADYDRKAVFGENPYYRYFKKYKKSYPVMMQLESYLLKGRPFPSGSPINAVAFLAELETQALLGTHDVEQIEGVLELFCGSEKIPFPGMRGEEVHIYPGDISGRDDGGIILSMIAGADERTCLSPDSRHVVYLVFPTPSTERADVEKALDRLAGYAATLAPTAGMERMIV